MASFENINRLALTSVILGSVSVAFFWIVPAVLAFPAVIFGYFALRQIQQSPQRGRVQAIWGIITGSLAIVLSIALGALISLAISN
jgi:uncharacterized protein HemY